jgi:uncharacterized protein
LFLIGTTRYRYGFEVDRQNVKSEWLYQTLRSKESELFSHKNGNIKVSSKFKEGKSLESKTRKDALFLSVASQFNGGIATEIMTWYPLITCAIELMTERAKTKPFDRIWCVFDRDPSR